MWFDQAAAAQNQGTQGALMAQAIQAGQAQNALQQGQDQAAAALRAAQEQGAAAINRGIETYNPYNVAGVGATNQLAALFGQGGAYTQQPTLEQLQMDPGYAFRLQQGEQAMNRSAAAQAGLQSGAALKAATRYGQEAGSQEYQNAYNRFMANRAQAVQGLQNLSGTGLTAAGGIGGLSGNLANMYANTGANLANVYQGGGQQLAANYNALGQNVGQGLVNQGAANASAYTNTANLLGALAGQGLQAAAMYAGGGGAGIGNAARGLLGSAIPSSYNMAMYSPHR